MRRMMWAPVLAALLLAVRNRLGGSRDRQSARRGSDLDDLRRPGDDGREGDRQGGSRSHATGPRRPGANPGPGPDDDVRARRRLDRRGLRLGGTWFGFGDFLIDSIASEQASDATQFWGIALNYVPTRRRRLPAAGRAGRRGAVRVRLLRATSTDAAAPEACGAAQARRSGSRSASVTTSSNGTVPAARRSPGASCGRAVAGAATGADGRLATRPSDSPGSKRLKAERPGSIRSNAWQVCVEDPGTGDCGGFSPASSARRAARQRDRQRRARRPASAVRATAAGTGAGRACCAGVAADDRSGVKQVKLALRRHVRGKGCQWWSGRREKFVGRNCHKKFFFAIGSDANWSYLLPRPLGPGHYVLDVKVFDAAGNRARRVPARREPQRLRRGRRSGAGRRRAAAASARVEAMVVGRQGVIVDPITVRARTDRRARVRAPVRRRGVHSAGRAPGRAASQAGRLRGPRLRQLRAAEHPQLGPAVRDPDRARAQQRRGRVGVQDRRPHAGDGRGGRAAADG